TTYANLGTFLIHKGLHGPQTPKSREELREGIAFLHKAIRANPDAHFGRAIWHAALAEFQLATLEKLELLLKYDMVGNSLDEEKMLPRGRMTPWRFRGLQPGESPNFNRSAISKVGAEDEWAKEVASCVKEARAFDEPVLGIVGIWRQDGPHAYSALALGNIMLRVGQVNLAWCAFERASLEFDRLNLTSKIREQIKCYCRKQQARLSVDDGVRERFGPELKFGQEYQKAYQEYEDHQLARGWAPDSADFYKDFEA